MTGPSDCGVPIILWTKSLTQTTAFSEGRYDRGYGRPVAGRIDGYEVRNYGWNLGNGR